MFELVATKANPVPPGAKLVTLRTQDGRSLRAATFTPSGSPRGTVTILQGRAEFIEKYFETIGELLQRNFTVAALDWRGQGGSDRELANPRKGHVRDFEHYQIDLRSFVAQILERECPRPWFALAHSMGGAIALQSAHGGDRDGAGFFERLVLTAPMIDLAGLAFPNASRWLAKTLNLVGLGRHYVPGGGDASLLELAFPGNKLTSDPVRFERNVGVIRAAPSLALGDATIGWADAAFDQMRRFTDPEFIRASRIPALFLDCARDEIVDARATERFAQRRDLSLLVTIRGARHELLMERDELRAQFWASFDAFIPGLKTLRAEAAADIMTKAS